MKEIHNQKEIDQAFPHADPGVSPLGSRVLVQIRRPKKQTKGGIILTADSQDTEKWNTQVALVRSIGPLAFRNRQTKELWPEGAWVEIGDFVRVPKYGGDRFDVQIGPDIDDVALFCIVDDLNLVARVYGNPLEQKAYV